MHTFDLDQYWPFPPEASARSAEPPPTIARAFSADQAPDRTRRQHADTAPVAAAKHILTFDLAAHMRELRSAMRAVSQVGTARGTAFLSSFDAKAAVWLSTGFICGMISWHAVGFWSFVSDSVRHTSTRPAVAVAGMPGRPPLTPPSRITTGSLPSFRPQPGSCMALTVDRDTGVTLSQLCNNDDQPLRDAGRRRRGDRLSNVQARMNDGGAWASATTTATQSLTNSTPATEPIAEHDFDLTINATP